MLKTTMELGRDPTQWRHLRRGSGAASRIFKKVDATLSLIVLQQFVVMVKRGAEIEWDPLPIVDNITGFWHALLDFTPPPTAKPKESKHGMPHILEPGKPQILKMSRRILLHAHLRRVAVIKVSRIAGHILSPELVNIIVDEFVDGSTLLSVDNLLRSFDSSPNCNLVGVHSWNLDLTKKQQNGGFWGVTYTTTNSKK